MASSPALLSLLSPVPTPRSLRSLTIASSQQSIFLRLHHRQISAIRSASSLVAQSATTTPQDLVESILSKVNGTDRGVKLAKDEHQEVADVATQLAKFCVDAPVKCPLIFGEWDVVYCSVPTSPGGGYRTAIGRLIFKTDEMIQVVEAPDIVRNRVSFSLFGFIEGQVSLKGKFLFDVKGTLFGAFVISGTVLSNCKSYSKWTGVPWLHFKSRIV